jgi:HK97 family phage major capsid protein
MAIPLEDMFKNLSPEVLKALKERAAQRDEYLAKKPEREKEFLENHAGVAEAKAGVAEELVEKAKKEMPASDQRIVTIESLQAEIDKWKQAATDLYASINKPDLSNVDLSEEDRKEAGLLPHQFKSFQHFAYDLATEGENGSLASDELKSWRSQVKATLTVGAGESAGTLVPMEFSSELLDRQKQINPILSRAMIVPMGTNKITIPYLESFDESQGLVYGNVEFKWPGEEGQGTVMNFETGGVELVLHTATGMARVSRDLLNYSPVSIEGILRRAFDYGLGRLINRMAIRGTGAGQPQGVLNATCTLAIPKEISQAADTFIYDNVLAMLARFYSADDSLDGAVWMANKTLLPQIGKLSVAVGTGGSGIFLANGQVQPVQNFALMGIPVQWSTLCSKAGDLGDNILADWSQYLIGQPSGRPGAEMATSIHLYFDYSSTAFRINVDMDGQCWWPDQYTPEYGDSQSPFVDLAERA